MTQTKKAQIKLVETPSLAEEDVVKFLNDNPDFFTKFPDVITSQTAPDRGDNQKIIDLQNYMIKKLQAKLDTYEKNNSDLVQITEHNLKSQSAYQDAIISLLYAHGLHECVACLTTVIPNTLEVDVVNLVMEKTDWLALPDDANYTLLSPSHFKEIYPQQGVLLRDDILGDGRIYGKAASLVRSDAVAALFLPEYSLRAVLAFGSKQKDTFSEEQGTDMVTFFVNILEFCLNRCLRPYLKIKK